MSSDDPVQRTGKLPFLEALSESTEKLFEKINGQVGDYLLISLDDDLRHFVVEFVRFEEHSWSSNPETREINGKTLFRSPYGVWSDTKRSLTSRLPECKSLVTRSGARAEEFQVPATDFCVLVIHHSWDADHILFASQEARDLYNFLINRFAAQTARANMTAKFKLEKTVPMIPKDFMDGEVPLSDYQKVALMFSVGSEASALFMDKGTGKTAVSIGRVSLEASRHWKRTGKMMRVLIVCPNQVRSNWQNEFERFSSVPGKTIVIRGGKLKRIKLFSEAIKAEADCLFSATIVGYDSVAIDVDHLYAKVPWDLVITDESHYFKSDRTERFKALRKIREVSSMRMALTGTPIANTPFDLFAQFEFLGEGLSGFSSFRNFRSYYGQFKTLGDPNSKSHVEKLIALKNLPLLKERIARLSFAITKKEAGLQLPDKVYDTFEVSMTKAQSEAYSRIAESLAVELKDILDNIDDSNNRAMVINGVLTQLLRLAQITSGHIKWMEQRDFDGNIISPARVEQIPGINPKVEAVVELLTEEDRDPLGKTVIWCTFVEDIRVLSERLTSLGIKHGTYYGGTSMRDRDYNVDAFNNDPEFKVLICNPASAGEGLNLLGYNPHDPTKTETYCDHEIFFSQNWSSIERSQAEDRAHRRGTRVPVRITDLCIPNTIDETIRARVLTKLKVAMEIQDIRAILASVLNFSFDEE